MVAARKGWPSARTMPPRRGWISFWFVVLQRCRADGAPRKSGGGPPQSKTLARGAKVPNNAERLGVRQSSGAWSGG